MRDLRAKDSGRYNVRGLCVLFGKSKQAYYQYDENLALGKVFHSLEEVIAATALAADFYNNRRPHMRGKVFHSLEEVIAATALAADFYNNRRPHMSIGMMTPAEASETSGDRDMRWKSYRMMAIKSRNSLDIAEIPLPLPQRHGSPSDLRSSVNPRQY